MSRRFTRSALLIILLGSLIACRGEKGRAGPVGFAGQDGEPGAIGAEGESGPQGEPGIVPVESDRPLSAMVALSFQDDNGTGTSNIADYVKSLVQSFADDTVPAGTQFPLAAAATDSVRALSGLHANVVIKWLDPITFAPGPDGPTFGANADYIAYFGEGWDQVSTAPQFAGDDTAGWVWVNSEYISNDYPTATSAPTGQAMTLAKYLRFHRVLLNDVEADVWDDASLTAYIAHAKRQVGGNWMRIIQDPASGEWQVDRGATNYRFDATSNTLLRVTGTSLSGVDHDDAGDPLPTGVVAGITNDCSGGQTPWGTIITAEENVQEVWGDLEATWTSQQQFVPGSGFDPGGGITFPLDPDVTTPWGQNPDPNGLHNRDFYGYLAEIDVTVPPGEYEGLNAPGVGHKKIGAMGRARWENAAFVVDDQWNLIDGQPIVMYSGNDRRSGRIYKFVSSQPFTADMNRTQIRALLDQGTLYVAHFAGLANTTGLTMLATGEAPSESAPGNGQWLELSLTSTDIAPNATALGDPTRTIGAALADVNWNGIAGFDNQDYVLWALFTAAAKVGVMELNRPEDLDWNPLDPSGVPRLYVAFTNSGRQVALDQDGVLYDPSVHETQSPLRPDKDGAIFVIQETDPANPAASNTFEFFQVWRGSQGEGRFDAANPDNIMFDADGGVWFGTDGNFSRNGKADSIYYLDLDPAHQGTTVPTFGQAFRVAAVPSDAEATGPAFSAGMGTLFMAVQHPGEFVYSTWPQR